MHCIPGLCGSGEIAGLFEMVEKRGAAEYNVGVGGVKIVRVPRVGNAAIETREGQERVDFPVRIVWENAPQVACSRKIAFAGGYMSLPSSSRLVAADAIRKRSASPAFCTMSLKMNSAIGDLQILPWHTKSIFVKCDQPPEKPYSAPFCRNLPTSKFCEQNVTLS